MIVTVRRQGAGFVGEPDSLITKCPSKFTARKRLVTLARRRCCSPACPRARGLRDRRVDLRRARAARARGSHPAAARSTRWPRVLTLAFAILEAAFLRSDFSFARRRPSTRARRRRRSTGRPRRGRRRRARCCCGCGCCRCGRASRCSLDPPPAARRRRRGRQAVLLGLRRLLHRAAAVPRRPVRAPASGAAGGRRAQPAAAPPEHDVPPADALLGVHAVRDPVRVRRRRADRAPASTPSGSARRAASRSPPGSSSASASCSARAGRTPSSAGAATGPGTRSRTPR